MKKSKVLKGIALGSIIIILILLSVLIGKLIGEYISLTAQSTSLEVSMKKLRKVNESLEDKVGKLNAEYASLQDLVDVYENRSAAEAEENKEKLAISLVTAYLEGAGYVPDYIRVDHVENGIYIVHAYDVIMLPEGDGLSATVGWYDVDVETMEVTSMF